MLFTILRHQPIGVDTAASAEDAWQKVTTCDYALIVIDMDVPRASPFLARFRDERPEASSFVLAVRDVRMTQVKADDRWKLVRDDPRYAALMQTMKLA